MSPAKRYPADQPIVKPKSYLPNIIQSTTARFLKTTNVFLNFIVSLDYPPLSLKGLILADKTRNVQLNYARLGNPD